MSSPPSTSDSLPSPRFSRATKFESKSLSVIADHDSSRDSLIRDLKNQVKRVTQERDALLEYVKGVNDMVSKLAFESAAADNAIREATKIYSRHTEGMVHLHKSLKDPSDFLLEKRSSIRDFSEDFASKASFVSETIILPDRYVTILKDAETHEDLETLTKEGLNHFPHIPLLQSFPLFASFPRNTMEKIDRVVYDMTRKKGQVILTKGEEASEIYFIRRGIVSIFMDGKELTTLTKPAFFGELGVLFKFKRTATVVAKTDVIMIVITKQKLDEIISNSPYIQGMVDEFSNNKEIWWLRQQYVSEQEKFGAEFANDIARKNIRKLDVFTDAPDSFIDTLAMKMACMVVQPQDNIISINEDSDAIYFLVTGTVEVVGPTGIVHAEIQSGSFFGEVGVMLNMKRTASIRAKGQCSVFQLTKENLFKTVSLYPSMHDKIQEAAAERFTLFKSRSEKKEVKSSAGEEQLPDQFDLEVGGQSLTKLSLFRGVDPVFIHELAIIMRRKTWGANETILRCGDEGTSMFFLAAGNAEIISEFGEVIDEVSGPSAYFGEVAILEMVPRTATVKCVTVCSTYELRKDDMEAVLEKYPEIAAQIKETADLRMQKYLMRNVLA